MKILIYDKVPLFIVGLSQALKEIFPGSQLHFGVDSRNLRSIQEKHDLLITGLDSYNDFNLIKLIHQPDWNYRSRQILVLDYQSSFIRLTVHELMGAGLKHILSKEECTCDELKSCFQAMLAGNYYHSPYVQTRFARHRDELENNSLLFESLSSREREYLKWYCQKLSSKDIAEVMHISISTVNSHKEHVIFKLQLRNSNELLRYCIQHPILRDYFHPLQSGVN